MITDFLLTAYGDIEFGCNRENIPNKDDFERALAAVFLLGTPVQVGAVERFMTQMAANNRADTTELLESLRDDLRNELGLAKVSSGFRFLRLARHKNEMQHWNK